jgi:hypothetical protein
MVEKNVGRKEVDKERMEEGVFLIVFSASVPSSPIVLNLLLGRKSKRV